MMRNANRFKLRFEHQPKFYENLEKKAITCILLGHLTSPFGCGYKNIEGLGVARCHPNDVFDAEKGRKVALLKAKINIRKKALNELLPNMMELNDIYLDGLNFFDRATTYEDYDRQYIRKITSDTLDGNGTKG